MRILDESIVIRNKNIDVIEVDGEKVMMNMEMGKYFSLNSVGSHIWDLIDRKISVRELVDKLIDQYKIDKAQCNDEVAVFLEKLNKGGLIEVD